MLGKLREFVEKAHQSDAANKATRAKQRAAAAEAKIELASLDTLGSLGKFNSLSQFNPLGQSGSFGQLASLNRFTSAGLPPGPASAPLGPGLGLESKGRVSAMVDKMTNDVMDSAIHNMWTRVVMSWDQFGNQERDEPAQGAVTKGNSVSAALLRSSLPRWVQRALVLLVALLLSACEAELYNNLDQRQANEMVATLQQRGIPAQRVAVKGGQYTVVVDKGRFADSIAILKEAGLPKQEFQNMGQVFKKDGLVSSPMQERAQMIFALSQELSRTVSEIDGVLSARVHLVLPENDPLRQQLVPSSASVFIRHRSNMPVGNLVPQVKMLVANGVAGLSYDKVSVVLVPVDLQKASQGQDLEMVSFFGVWMQRDNLAQAMWMFFGLVALVVLLAGALGFVFFRQRGRVYALGSPRPVPSSVVTPRAFGSI